VGATQGYDAGVVVTRTAHPGEFERIAAFYRDNGYGPPINPADVIVVAEVAENEGALCGAVRMCDEHGVLVLRGMRVCEDMRGQGIGTRLLQAVEPVIGARECFCIPHRYLRSFYGRIGFVEIEPTEAPPFLRERWAAYGREYGLDVILMRRPGGAKVRRLQSTASASSLPSPAAH
jgi:N-acetylglutamate synthase-like GNAT family acetyltransferase